MQPGDRDRLGLTGKITDPRDLGIPYPEVRLPERPIVNADMLVPPLPEEQARQVQLEKTPNIVSLPELPSIPTICNFRFC